MNRSKLLLNDRGYYSGFGYPGASLQDIVWAHPKVATGLLGVFLAKDNPNHECIHGGNKVINRTKVMRMLNRLWREVDVFLEG